MSSLVQLTTRKNGSRDFFQNNIYNQLLVDDFMLRQNTPSRNHSRDGRSPIISIDKEMEALHPKMASLATSLHMVSSRDDKN